MTQVASTPAAVLFEQEMRGTSQLQLKDPLPILYPIVGYRYRSEAILSEDAAPLAPDAIELLEPPLLSGLPGSRVPHVWIEQQGQRLSTPNLLDERFVLLTGAGGSAWSEAAEHVAANLGIALAAYRIGPGADLRDLENGWPAKLGVSPEGAVFVRPDGFVAWRTSTLTTPSGPRLLQVLSHILCREAL